jgi:hypothetical protein
MWTPCGSPYLFAFAPWVGRWKPLRKGRRAHQDGIEHMIEA